MGYFQGREGETYRLDLDALEDGSALQPYDPRVEVKVDLFTLDGYAIEDGLSQLASSIAAGIGFLMTVPAIVSRIKSFVHSKRARLR